MRDTWISSRRVAAIGLGSMLLVAATGPAGVNTWTSGGPGVSAEVTALAIEPDSPSTIYGGTRRSGVFRSKDGGDSWEAASDGLPLQVVSIAIGFDTPATVYAVTGEGLFATHDEGKHWAQIVIPGTGRVVLFAPAPGVADTLYAVTSALDDGVNIVPGGVFQSTDRGATWRRQASEGSFPTSFAEMIVDPFVPTTIYAREFGVPYKSTNGGATWDSMTGLGGSSVQGIAVDPRNRGTLYAVGTWSCFFSLCGGGGVFKTTDGGGHWSAVGRGTPYVEKNQTVNLVGVEPATSAVYVGGGEGLYRSRDGGRSWNRTAIHESVGVLAFDPTTPSRLFVGDQSGFRRSLDGGESWEPKQVGFVKAEIDVVALDPLVPGAIYAAGKGGLFRSADGGGSWTSTAFGRRARWVTCDAANSGVLYAADADWSVYKSTDAGASWHKLDVSAVSLYIDPLDSNVLFASSGRALHKSTDAGATWDLLASFADAYVGSLALDPRNPATLYAGAYPSFLKSIDGGASWTTLEGSPDGGPSLTPAIAIDPRDPNIVYGARFEPYGILKSTDGGATWRDPSSGSMSAIVSALILDPVDPSRLYAGTYEGVFRSHDGGATWTLLDAGLGNAYVSSLAIDPSGTQLHAGTIIGVFDYRVAPLEPCVPGPSTLCLGGGRFRVEADWRVPSQGTSGPGTAVRLTPDTGYFWFFNRENVEVIVKVLDGCGLNRRQWVFAGGLTNVEVTLTVSDTATGDVKSYVNPANTAFRPIQDTSAFAGCTVGSSALQTPSWAIDSPLSSLAEAGTEDAGPCAPDSATLCLSGGRFQLRADWEVPSQDRGGRGAVVPLTPDTGYFWFFGETNIEIVVKVLAGCPINGHFWVFAGGLTNVGVRLTVTDTRTGEVQAYVNPADTAFLPIQDTAAFPACE